MRARRAFLSIPLVLLLVPALARQEESTQDPVTVPPFTAHAEKEQARLEKELTGAWNLIEYQFTGRSLDAQNAQGFAFFMDGHLSVTLQVQAIEAGILGSSVRFYYQAGVYRFRVNEYGHLQTASIMGFDNMNPGLELDFIGGSSVREHPISISEDLLTMRNADGSVLVFQKARRAAFPRHAMEWLLRNPGGGLYDGER